MAKKKKKKSKNRQLTPQEAFVNNEPIINEENTTEFHPEEKSSTDNESSNNADNSSEKNTSKGISDTTKTNSKDACIDEYISKLSTTLKDLNDLRENLISLELNPEERIYFNNSVTSLLTILNQLSTTSYNLASSCNLLSTSIITPAKNSKIKDTIRLIYSINKECENVFSVLKCKIDLVVDLGCEQL